MKMNYVQAVEHIEKLGVFGIKAGLERIEYLLDKLGNPHHDLKCIHVAGTNGKGSVCTMLEAMLTDYKVAKFTSPHLVKYNERFCINGTEITDEEFAKLVTVINPIVKAIPEDLKPTQFELLTAMAFLYFKECMVDYAIIEVGLGGLLDSTNVIKPLVSVITNVDMDHMDKCGETIGEIAAHKAGIIKRGVPVVTAAVGEALEVITAKGKSLCCPMFIYREKFSVKCLQQMIMKNGKSLQTFNYRYRNDKNEKANLCVRLSMLGTYQPCNAAVALTVIRTLFDSEKMVELAPKLFNAHWAGRIEVVGKAPAVILDGAHNLAGAEVLRATLDTAFAGRQIFFVLGFMKDKDIRGIIKALVRDEDMVIPVVADPDYPRSASFKSVIKYINEKHYPMTSIRELSHEEAIKTAKRLAGKQGVVCIAGSLYMIGKMKKENLV